VGAGVDHGVEVETTGEHENRAADRGCCVSTCSLSSCYSLEMHDGGVILMPMEGNEIILNAEDTRNLGKYLMEITNQD
jgi:hypothetical protein